MAKKDSLVVKPEVPNPENQKKEGLQAVGISPKPKLIKVGFGIVKNKKLLINIGGRWYRFDEIPLKEETKILVLDNIPIRVFCYADNIRNVFDGKKKGFAVYLSRRKPKQKIQTKIEVK